MYIEKKSLQYTPNEGERAFSWHPWIPGTLKFDSILSLFKCAPALTRPGEKGQLQAFHQGEKQGGGEPLLRRPAAQVHRQTRQAAQVIQASQLQSPGERPGAHSNILNLSELQVITVVTRFSALFGNPKIVH